MASKKPSAREDFESLYKRLEEGGLTLEQSVALYEEGMKLARRCQELLQKAELKVAKLQEEFASLREEPEPYEVGEEEEEEIPLE